MNMTNTFAIDLLTQKPSFPERIDAAQIMATDPSRLPTFLVWARPNAARRGFGVFSTSIQRSGFR